MPNHVRNRLSVSGPEADVAALAALVKDDEQEFSFHKVIPMPPILQEVHSGGCTINGLEAKRWFEREENGQLVQVRIDDAEAARMRQQYGGADWYEWAVKHWGTKWDAYDVWAEVQPRRALYEFNSAWSPPEPVLRELSRRFPSLILRLRCDGEIDQPFSCTFQAGEVRP